jgi:hypothetical protein
MSADPARGNDTRAWSRGQVVADPLRQSLDTFPAPQRVDELSIWGDGPLEQDAPPLGVNFIPRLEVRVDDLVQAITIRPRV